MEDKITLRLIRHGQTRFNAEGRYMGRTDVDLCDDGREQIREIFEDKSQGPGAELSKVMEMDPVIFSSPMKRCLQTAGIIFPGAEPIVIKDLREMDFGIFEGRLYDELKDMPQFRAFVDSSGEVAPPEGEDRAAFIARVTGAVEESLRIISERGKRAGVLVMHGGTIMALMNFLHGGNYYDYLPKNGGGYTLELSRGFSGQS